MSVDPKAEATRIDDAEQNRGSVFIKPPNTVIDVESLTVNCLNAGFCEKKSKH
jgi:hypothetical protein